MKKLFTLMFTLILALAILTITATAATTTNLIPNDPAKWTKNEGNGFNPNLSFDGTKLVVTSEGGWPSIQYKLDNALKLDPATTTVNLKFTLKSGATSIRLMSNNSEQIVLNHFLKNVNFDGSGDLVTAGTYEASFALKDLKCDAGTADNSYLGTKDLVLEDGKFVLTEVTIYCVGASIEIEKLEIVAEGTTEESKTEEPKTGDYGVAIPMIIALASLAGAGVLAAKKSR